jgi:hypothetical protein
MIQETIDKINERLAQCLDIENAIFYGLTMVVNVNGETYPVTIIDGKLVKICPNDKIDVQVYHRLVSISYNESEVYSFGRNSTYETTIAAKMIVIVKNDALYINPLYSSESFSLPPKIYIPEEKAPIYISKTSNSVIFDHDSIVNREWKKIDYSKHKCKFFVFEVNYTLSTVSCKGACDPPTESEYIRAFENGGAVFI